MTTRPGSRCARLEPPRPRWFRWVLLAIFAASVDVVPTLAWLLR